MEQKDAYWEMQRAKLQELEEQMKALQPDPEGGSGHGESPHEELLRALRAERDAAEEKLSELKAAGTSAWEELRSGVEQALSDLQAGVEKAVSELRHKT